MRVLLADDQAKVRSALRLLLDQEPGLTVVGEAAETGDLLAQVQRTQPDLVLLDWELPGLRDPDLLTPSTGPWSFGTLSSGQSPAPLDRRTKGTEGPGTLYGPSRTCVKGSGTRSGQQLLSALHSLGCHLKVIALSGRLEACEEALAAGADAFVSKGDPPERLLTALRTVDVESEI